MDAERAAPLAAVGARSPRIDRPEGASVPRETAAAGRAALILSGDISPQRVREDVDETSAPLPGETTQ